MKLTYISIDNILGVSHIDTALPTPAAVFCGANHAGKSSIREAIRAAFLGMPERVLRKKDLGQLVHDGQKGGSVVLDIEGGQATFTAPGGKQELAHDLTMHAWERQALALPYCLDPAAFAAAPPDERRQLLFALTGASSKKEDIVAAMRERGLAEGVIEAATPMLRAGFPAAAKFAEERCRDAKAFWKATTGETYGHVKAETWSAPAPGSHVDETAIAKLQEKVATLGEKIAAEHTKLGAAEQKLKSWLAAEENRETDKKTFARLASAEAKLARDLDDLQRWQEQVKLLEQKAGTGPRVGLVHDLARAVAWFLDASGLSVPDEHVAALEAYEAQYGLLNSQGDPEAAAKLPEGRRARDLMARSVENDRRDIEAAKAAGARLERQIEKGSDVEVESIQAFLAGYQQELDAATVELDGLRTDKHAAAQAQKRTETAAAAHREAQDWQAALDALSPSGIPADILGRALDPFNQALLDLADLFAWPGVRLDADMMIAAGNRAYGLLSESERWRTDAIIVLALAEISGLKFAAFDRFDILDIPGRSDFVAGLDTLGADGDLDTALVFGTLKKLPNFEGFPGVTGFWVEDGRIAETTTVVRETAVAQA